MRCLICNNNKSSNLLNLDCGNFDESVLYQTIRIVVCVQCGHIYNKLTSAEIAKLAEYYNEEYAPINIHALYKTGGMPGGDSPLAFERYSKLFDFVRPHIKKGSKILDVGCASGGFLNYLYQQGLCDLYGIDPTAKFIDNAKTKKKFQISIGSAESIPFKDKTFDVVIIDNVIEHLVNPSQALMEAKRVLTDGGVLYLGAPDAANYHKASFEFLWFLFKEHIQHFDIRHLELLAAHEGFDLLAYREFDMPTTSKGIPIPALGVAFRLTGHESKLHLTRGHLKLKEKMENYVAKCHVRLNKKREIISGLIVSKQPLYVWGIGSEFFYLYESIGLKECNIVELVDINSYKQKTFTIDGKKIKSPSILKEASVDSTLLICATIHTKEILERLSELAYPGQVIKMNK